VYPDSDRNFYLDLVYSAEEMRRYGTVERYLLGKSETEQEIIHRLLGHAQPVQNGVEEECATEVLPKWNVAEERSEQRR
jgi:hypothetical protein